MAQPDHAAALQRALTKIEIIMGSLLETLSEQRQAVADADLPRLLAAVARQDEQIGDLAVAERARLEAMIGLEAEDLPTAISRLPVEVRLHVLGTCDRIATLIRQVDEARAANQRLIDAALRSTQGTVKLLGPLVGPIEHRGRQPMAASLVDQRV
jgi:hypothetical protein